MKSLKIFSLLVVFVAGLIIVGCKKSGAPGSTGPTGPAGAAGGTGAAGDTGKAGNGALFYSPWIQLSMTKINDSLYAQDVAASAITQGVLDSGVVLIYKQYDSAGVKYVVTDSQNPRFELRATFSIGYIHLKCATDESYGTLGYEFKYVIMYGSGPVGNSSSGSIYTRQQLRTMTYEELVKAFGIKETGSPVIN